MTAQATYIYRRSILEPETVLELEGGPDGGVLRIARGDGSEIWLLSEIESVRLAYNPTRFDLVKYECRLQRRGGGGMIVTSTSYKGVGRFQDNGPEYRVFITALHSALATSGAPGVRFVKGSAPFVYWGSLGCAVGGLGMLLLVLLVTGAILIPAVALTKLAILLFMVPWAVKYAKKNRPGAYDPGAVPQELLPE